MCLPAKRRALLVALGFALLVTMLCARLADVQVISGRRLAAAAVDQRTLSIPGPGGGDILDSGGRSLTCSQRRYAVIGLPGVAPADPETARAVASAAGLEVETVSAALGRSDGRPSVIARDVDEGAARRVWRLHVPGVLVACEQARYGAGGLAEHVTGYVRSSDGVGMSGVEKAFDDDLRPVRPAGASVVVDALGRAIPGLCPAPGRTESRGFDVCLTIDSRVQRVVEEVADELVPAGAVVVLSVPDADVLAMASRPGYDRARVEEYLEAPRSPLVNRAVTAYPPGSVFKMVVAAAALQEGRFDLDDTFECRGHVEVGDCRFRCHVYPGGHGRVTLVEALARSCNVAFVNVGLALGRDVLLEYAGRFGLGRKTGCGLPEEQAGVLPDRFDLVPAGIANYSLGQGPLRVTPLQMAAAVCAVASGGCYRPPRLVKGIRAPDGYYVRRFARAPARRILSPSVARRLRSALARVVYEGTGSAAMVPEVGSAGKTGTAQTGGDPHSWFVGYAPASRPRYAVAIFVEGGGYGGEAAAPAFREIVERLVEVG